MSGFLTRAALALEVFGTSPVWPAAAPQAVTALLPLLSENVRDVPVTQEISRRLPRSGIEARTLRAVRVDGPMSLRGVYDGLEAVWAWALGLQHSSRPTELVEGAYQHLYELDPVAHSHAWPFGAFNAGDIDFKQQLVRRATLAVERTTSVWEHLSTMVRSLTVHASPNGVSLALNLVGHSTDRASATNTSAVLAALAEPDWPFVEFHQLEARLAPFSASTALDSDDAISLSAFRLDVSHHLKTRQRRDTGLYIGEPRRDQLPEVFGSLTLPYYDSDQLIDWARAQTVLMAELRFTGAAIAATGYNYQLAFWLPALQLDAVEAGTQGPADRDQSLNFRALVSDTAPAGFPTFALAGPLYVELVSADSVNPLSGADQAGEGGGGAGEGEIFGFVFGDEDGDGTFNGAEVGFADVVIQVVDADSAAHQTSPTDSTGLWSLPGLAVGNATVSVFSSPADYHVTNPNYPLTIDVQVDGSHEAEDLGFEADEGGGGEELGGVTDGLRIWFKADDLAASLSDADPVASWTDASGNEITVTQATGSAQPTYKTAILNGHDVVRFDGNDVLSGDNPISDLTNQFTIFVVSTNLTSVTLGPFIATVAGTWDGVMLFYWASISGAAYLHTENQTTYRRGVTSLVPGPSLCTARYEGGVGTDLYYNGVLDNGAPGTTPSSISNTAPTLRLGARDSSFMNGDLAELVLYDVALSPADREAVEAALMTKYGLS